MIPSASSLNPQILGNSSYIFILLLMIIEGPIITYLAAFASSLGLLNLYIIFLLASLGNIVGDLILYYVGKLGNKAVFERYFKKKILKKSLVKKIEYNLKTHTGKALAFIKIVPPLPVPGLIMAGIVEVPIEKFFFYSVPISITTALIFTLLGFITGEAYKTFFTYFKKVELAITATLAIVLLGWLLFRYFENQLKKFEIKRFKTSEKP